jgi:hypothetical protein
MRALPLERAPAMLRGFKPLLTHSAKCAIIGPTAETQSVSFSMLERYTS